MLRTFTATRVWNCTRPSVAVITSSLEELAHRLDQLGRGRAVVGRGHGRRTSATGASDGAPAEERPEPACVAGERRCHGSSSRQVVLVLAHTAADGGQLDRAAEPEQMGRRLHDADDAPLQRAERLPPSHDVGIDFRPRRRRVGVEQVLVLTEPTHRLRRAEPPRPYAQPAEVLQRVADVRDLPVEHGPQAVRTDDEVAEAEVAVHDGRALGAADGSGRASADRARSRDGARRGVSRMARYWSTWSCCSSPGAASIGIRCDRGERFSELRRRASTVLRRTRRRGGSSARSSRPRHDG